MKCPTCLSTMKCISEIHAVPGQPGKERMDLHCYNRNEPREPNRCRVTCHMGVITEDPNPWICHIYNFSFIHNGDSYLLSSQDTSVDPRLQGFRKPLTILKRHGIESYRLPYFIPISTGDNMHEEAWKLFHRLRNLAIFS